MKYENDSERYTFCTWQLSDNLQNQQHLLDEYEINCASFIGLKIIRNENDENQIEFLLKLENNGTRKISAIDIKLKWSKQAVNFLEKKLRWIKPQKSVTFATDIIEERNDLLGDPIEIICKFPKFSSFHQLD